MRYIQSLPLIPIFSAILCYCVIWSIRVAIYKPRVSIKREVLKLLFFCYSLGVLFVTLFPLQYTGEPSINIVPFHSIWSYIIDDKAIVDVSIRNILGNIVIFIPMGLLLSVLCKNMRVIKLAVVGVLASVSIECIQLVLSVLKITTRVVDVDDVILNSVGYLTGFAVYYVYNVVWNKIKLCKADHKALD
ncbi:VanZ family protein [Paenibacillus sp. UMB4589-SE434]|uniref:VanZ family protein n=1 Tax=Paenibacillus sp. UMB4589-SE434 TaxID=3046314 RepID=UPI00254DEDBA|nr:VanZ family protein [Paenibacillus sp. UMB4589-SE434]